jgi:ABC-type proline/glycine betaine transport system permease subunit
MGVACSACVIYQIKEFFSLSYWSCIVYTLYILYTCTAVAMIVNLRYGVMIAYLAPRTRKEREKKTIPANSTT